MPILNLDNYTVYTFFLIISLITPYVQRFVNTSSETGLGRGSYGRYNNGLIPARANNAWVYQDMNGSTVINTPYKWANEFSHGYAVVGNTVYEIIDTQGNVTFRDSEKKYEDIGSFSTDGIAAAKLKYQADVGYRYEYIDRFGNVVIREQYDEAGKFYHGYAVVRNYAKLSSQNCCFTMS